MSENPTPPMLSLVGILGRGMRRISRQREEAGRFLPDCVRRFDGGMNRDAVSEWS